MRSPESGVADAGGRRPGALTIARVVVMAGLALLAAGAAFMFVAGATFDGDGESTWVHLEAVLLGSAGIVVGSCTAIWGLARALRRAALAGAAGVTAGAIILLVAAESLSPPDEEIEYVRVLFVLVLGLVVAVARLGSGPRAAP